MILDVILVCSINVLIFLGLLWLLPRIWQVRSALSLTARRMNTWSEGAEKALAPAPVIFLRLRQTLRRGQETLTKAQKWLKLWATLIGLGQRILKILRTSKVA